MAGYHGTKIPQVMQFELWCEFCAGGDPSLRLKNGSARDDNE